LSRKLYQSSLPTVQVTGPLNSWEKSFLSTDRSLLHTPLELLLALALQVLLLRLGVKLAQLLVALGLLGLLALLGTLLGLGLLLGLLDLANLLVAHNLHLAQHLRAEVSHLNQVVGHPQEVLEDRKQRGVVVVGWDAILEDDALTGTGLVKAGLG